jgi:hypothetical protein
MEETNDGESKYSELKEALNPLGVHTDCDGVILFIYHDADKEDAVTDILNETEHVYLKKGESAIKGYDKEIWIDETVITIDPDEID